MGYHPDAELLSEPDGEARLNSSAGSVGLPAGATASAQRCNVPAGQPLPWRELIRHRPDRTHFRLFPRYSQAALRLPSLDVVMETGILPQRQQRPGRAGPAPRRPPPGMLAMSIQRRGAVIELGLSGDLDMATAPRLRDAMAWLRVSSDPTTTIVIDTSDVDFIAAAGYRALQAALVGPNGLWDPVSPSCRRTYRGQRADREGRAARQR